MEDPPRFTHLTLHQRKWVRIVCGYVAGMALGLSGVVWSKAVIADVWTLSLLLFTAILCLALCWMLEPERKRLLCASFLLLGLLVTGSQEMILALPGLVLIAMLGDRDLGRDLALAVLPLAAILGSWNQFGVWIGFPRQWNGPSLIVFTVVVVLGIGLVLATRCFGSTWKFALLCLTSFVLGLSLCLYLPVASMTNPPMNWGDARAIGGFFHLLTRSQYEFVHPTDGLDRFARQLWMFLKMSGKEWGWLYFLPAALPLCLILGASQAARKWLFALVMVFLCTGPMLLAEINPGADHMSQELAKCYFMPAFATVSIMAGLGLVIAIGLMTNQNPCWRRRAALSLCLHPQQRTLGTVRRIMKAPRRV